MIIYYHKIFLVILLLFCFSCSLPSMNCLDVANRIQFSLAERGIESKQLYVWNYDSKLSHIFVIYANKNGRLYAIDAFDTIPVGNKWDNKIIAKFLHYDLSQWRE